MYESRGDIELGIANNKRPSSICYLFALPAIIMIFIFKIIPFTRAIALPFKEYIPFKGMTGSPWVGMQNFSELFSSGYFSRILGNTLILKIEYILVCSLIALVLALIISLIKSRKLQKLFSAIFLLPYFIPTAVLSYFVLQMMSMEGPGFLFTFHTISFMKPQTFRTAYIAIEVVKNIGIPVIIALGAIYTQTSMSNGKENYARIRVMPALKAIGLFALIQLSALLTTDFELLNNFQNPLVLETAETFDTYSYKNGLVQAKYGVQAAVWLIQFIVQLILAIPIYLLIKNFFTKGVFSRKLATKNSMNVSGNPASSSLGIIIGFLVVLLLFVPLILSLTQIGGLTEEVQGMVDNSLIGRSFLTYIPLTLIAVVINAIITALLAYPLTVHNLSGKKVYEIFLIIVLSMGVSGIHDYIFYKDMGWVNTYVPYLFTGMVTIVNVFVLKAIYNARYTQIEERTAYGREGDEASFFYKYLPGIWKPLLGLAGLQFITIWNSYAPSQLWYVMDSSRFSPVMMFRNIMVGSQGEAYKAMAPYVMKMGFWVSLPSIIIGVLLVAFIGYEIFVTQIRKA